MCICEDPVDFDGFHMRKILIWSDKDDNTMTLDRNSCGKCLRHNNWLVKVYWPHYEPPQAYNIQRCNRSVPRISLGSLWICSWHGTFSQQQRFPIHPTPGTIGPLSRSNNTYTSMRWRNRPANNTREDALKEY